MSTPSQGGPEDPREENRDIPGEDQHHPDATGGDPAGAPQPTPPPTSGNGTGRPGDYPQYPAPGSGGYDQSGTFGQDPAGAPGYGGYSGPGGPAGPQNHGGPAGSAGYPGYPAQPTQPGYGGYAGYGGYGNPEMQSGYGIVPGQTEPGTGKIDVLRAVGWAFQVTFRNWKVWVFAAVGILLISLVGMVMYMMTLMSQIAALEAGEPWNAEGVGLIFFVVVVTIVSFALWLGLLRGSLHQIDDPKMGWGHFFRDLNAIPVILQQVLVGVVLTVVVLLPLVPLFGSIAALEQRSGVPTDEEVLTAIILPLILGVLGTVLIAVLITPFTMFMPYYLIERREGFLGSIRESVKAGSRNYGRLLLYQVVIALASGALSSATFGLSSALLMPVMILMVAHMYRQAAGGQVPVRA